MRSVKADPGTRPTKAVIARALALPDVEKFELLDVLVKDLGVGLNKTSKEHRRAVERREALEALFAVAEYLGLPAGEAPTIAQFNQCADELGLSWNSGRVIRIWERWRLAQEIFTGQRRASAFITRDFYARQNRALKDREDPVKGVKRWLKTRPDVETSLAYDAFVASGNAELREGEKRLRSAGSVRAALGLHWPSVIAVARGEFSITRARENEVAEMMPRATTDAILGLPGAVRLLGRKGEAVRRAAEESRHFPVAVAVIAGHRAWFYEDLKRYRRGLAAIKRSEGELQYLYMDGPELETRLKLSPSVFKRRVAEKRWDLVPRPEGLVAAGAPYWLRAKVEDWLRVKGKAELTPEQEDEIQRENARRAAALGASLKAAQKPGTRRSKKRRKRA
jgi:hypothetical protein